MDRETCLPVAIISCNRPIYLAQALEGLRASLKEANIKYEIGLFQDRPAEKAGGSSKDLSSDCVSLFKLIFPEGQVYKATSNLGIPGNYAKAEQWAFQEREEEKGVLHPAAFFLEDDFVPNKSTMNCINRLLSLEHNGYAIGAVSAAGHIQELQEGEISPMGQLWAYALTRKAYTKIKAKMDEYNDLYIMHRTGQTEQHPPLDQCLELATKWGYEPQAGGRDSFIAMALHSEGFTQIATKGVLGKYIGMKGDSFNEDIYRRLGWNKRQERHHAPSFKEIHESYKKQQSSLREHQEKQFNKSHIEFHSDSCKTAYIADRFDTCKQIAERALSKWGSCSCRGNPYSFERHLLKSLTRMGFHHEAMGIAKQAAGANLGTWGFWAIAQALEDNCSWAEAAECWQILLNNQPSNPNIAERMRKAIENNSSHPSCQSSAPYR
jgi:hypothetical protein